MKKYIDTLLQSCREFGAPETRIQKILSEYTGEQLRAELAALDYEITNEYIKNKKEK